MLSMAGIKLQENASLRDNDTTSPCMTTKRFDTFMYVPASSPKTAPILELHPKLTKSSDQVGCKVNTLNQYNKHHVSSNVVQCPSIEIGVTSSGSCVYSTVSNMDACSRAQHPAKHTSSESDRTQYPQNSKA